MRHLLFLCIFIFGFIGCASLPPLPPPDARMRIAVIGMSKGTVDQKIADMLTTTLSKNGYFTVVERERVNRVIEEQGFQLSGVVDPQTAVKLGELLDIQAVVKGEVVSTKVQPINWGIAITVRRAVTITAQVIDAKNGKTIAAVSDTGGSWAGGMPAEIEYGGQKRPDILGIKRSEEDMYNSAVRSAVEDVAVAIIKAVYEKDKEVSVVDVDAKPDYAIESFARGIPDSNYFVARAKTYYAHFNVVWIAVNRYLETQGNIITSDRDKGVVIAKKSISDFRLHDIALVEKISEDSTKVTVKAFCYKYSCYQGSSCRWEKLGVDFCSDIALNGIKKHIKKALEEQKK